MKNEQKNTADHDNKNALGMGISLGVAIGAGIGVAIDDVPVGIGVGIALGVAFGMMKQDRRNVSGDLQTGRDELETDHRSPSQDRSTT